MNIKVTSNEDKIARASLDIVRLFYPHANIFAEDKQYDLLIDITQEYLEANTVVKTTATMFNKEGMLESSWVSDTKYRSEAQYNWEKRVAILAVRSLLAKHLGINPSPWGTLTGIRPTKIVHRMLDENYLSEEVLARLINGYALSEDKANLVLKVAQTQRRYFLPYQERKNTVSIYIGIPFCPTRCVYCSFPSCDLTNWKFGTERFVDALVKEVEAVGSKLKEMGLKVETIYIGGGTPTSLPVNQIERIFSAVDTFIKGPELKEITVEAGRPDTFTVDKLDLIKQLGANRISINPQTMNEDTLQLIGRKHTVEQVFEAFEMAKAFTTVNLDLIIGLPNEDLAKVEYTLRQVEKLRPNNLTVHTMAIKRASNLNQNKDKYSIPSGKEVSKMLSAAYNTASHLKLHPYYLYRQKQILGGFENIGFAEPAHECIYNIQMMEERQTIIGLGGGSGSKWLNPRDLTLESTYNPKDPINYWERIDELIEKKFDKIHAFVYNLA